MKQVQRADKTERVMPFVRRAGGPLNHAKVARIVEAVGDRMIVFGDILLQGAMFIGDDVAYDEKPFAKRVMADGAPARLADFRAWLAGREAFDAAPLERDLAAYLAEKGLAPKDLVHAVRVAVTGTDVGAGLYDCLSILGKRVCLHRLDAALAAAKTAAKS